MAELKFTAEQFIAGIRGSAGIKLAIARNLNCNRNTVESYLRRYPSAQEAYAQEVEIVGDIAESVVISAIRKGDVETAKWYARVKLRDRGYGDSVELILRHAETLAKAYNLDPAKIIDLAQKRREKAS